jgi:A/G-specific adenine glycosylase
LSAALLRWYDAGRRDLPWRRTRDPYRILVSEVMLQQTQVARVVPYYERWLEAFPDAAALAAAPVSEVLRCWSGLGYNRRALALQRACAVVAADGWPGDAAGLRALPGVGEYTAAAVASFAFGERVAVVDTNVRRVLSRWDGVDRGTAALRERAAELLPRTRVADWNQALMELGATVCTARSPQCGVCPVGRCASRGAVGPPAARRAKQSRFEDTDRFVRGRLLAALVAGEAPDGDWSPERHERAVAGLVRDGLVVEESGSLRLP